MEKNWGAKKNKSRPKQKKKKRGTAGGEVKRDKI